ncbi:LysR family transcriptional regulator [Aquicoccus porphyridii]|uniref:LysR family transcriptional regulator n=1 Tax=Aquicoccus porphyridii TaxID=1852029 RepID=A0A5A9ZCM7_9RHOB|nr:LysR family transcriptional regulator [Aquicoccus porphyridii]KAA0914839.1 LysR family transcriptional regulator [Aquicoccus porphyridii]RAI52614.1 LysR family transcriptional regulator [Rhodobacteraceae bacterium AsT-22]
MEHINPINAEQQPDRFTANLDWNLLRSFIVIVEEGSITRAAHRLLRGQPAISLALQRLEQEFGTRLIDRGRGHFALTAAGRALYRECLDIHAGIAKLREATTLAQSEISGHVTIALASHVITPLLDDLLGRTYRAHPRVTYRIHSATSANVAAALRDRTASFGICLVNRRLPDLDYGRLYREFFGFYCGPAHPLFGQEGLGIEALKGLDAVSFETDDLNDALRPVALLRRQYELDQRIVGRSSHLEEVRRMILCGLGIGALPVHVAQSDVEQGRLWRLPPYDDPPAVDIYLLTNPRKRFNRAEKLMIDALQDAIATRPLAERTYPSV